MTSHLDAPNTVTPLTIALIALSGEVQAGWVPLPASALRILSVDHQRGPERASQRVDEVMDRSMRVTGMCFTIMTAASSGS